MGHDAAKRERILAAAVRVFADKGFFGARVSEIARAADVADGTIYLYFKSKEDLLISLFEDRMREINRRLRELVESGSDAIEKLRQLVHLHLRIVTEDRPLAEVLTVEVRQSAKFMKGAAHPRFREFLRLIVAIIADGQRRGVLRRDLAAPIVGRALFGALDELALTWLLKLRAAPPRSSELTGSTSAPTKIDEDVAIDLERVAEQIADLFIDGLRVSGNPRPTTHGARRKAS